MTTSTQTAQPLGVSISWREALIAAIAGLAALGLVVYEVLDVRHLVILVLALPLLAVIATRPEWGLVALFGAATLDVQGRLVEVAGVQFTLYQALAGFLFIVFIVRYKRGQIALPRTPLDVPLLVFMALAATSIVVAPSVLSSVVDWISLASSIFLMYAVVMFADSEKKLATVVWGAIAVSVALAGFALLERAGIYSIRGDFLTTYERGIRPQVTFGDTNMYGTLTYVALALAVPLLLQTKDWRLRVLGVAAVVLNVGALWATHSRGAWVAAAVVALVILALVRIPWWQRLAAIIVLVALALGFVVLESEFIAARITGTGETEVDPVRYSMILAGLDMAADYPFGVGLGGFPELFPLYRQSGVRAGLVESHMAYLTLLVETGLLGLLAYLWVLWRFAKTLLPAALRLPAGRDQALLVGSIAAVAGVATQALTYSLEGHKLLWFALGVGMAVYVRHRSSRPSERIDAAGDIAAGSVEEVA